MTSLNRFLRNNGNGSSRVSETARAESHRRKLIEELIFEVVPMKSLESALLDLPVGAEVSVTCSPVKGIEETQRVTEHLLQEGFRPVPHISARMVRDEAHTAELAQWFRDNGLTKLFLVGGDATEPGAYPDAVGFLKALLRTDHGLQTIGVPAYPDGHSFISDQDLRESLFAKQMLLSEAGIEAYCSTQMCFDPNTIAKWIRTEREHGLIMPIHLGIPGVVDKSKLVKMGVRLGIGQSLSYLRKNKTALVKMMTSTSYELNDLLLPLSEDMADLGVEALHVFTFNQVGRTNQWRLEQLAL